MGFMPFNDGGGSWNSDNVAGNILLIRIVEVSVRIQVGHLSINVVDQVFSNRFIADILLQVENQDNQGSGRGGYSNGFGYEPDISHLRNDQSKRSGRSCGG